MLAALRQLIAQRHLLWVMILREVKSRSSGTAGGWLWVYAQPLLTVAAYYLVFDVVFGMRSGTGNAAKGAGTFLIVGMLPWQGFAEALGRTAHSLLDAAHLLQKNAIPPVLVVLRTVGAAAVVHAPLLLGLVAAYWPLHQGAMPLLLFPLFVVLQYAMTWWLGHALAIMAAALRDVVQLLGFALSVGVFASPVLFPLEMFPAQWQWVLWLNPMTPWVLAYQDLLLHGAWPSAWVGVGMAVWLMLAGVLAVVLHKRSKDELVDWL